MFIHIIMALVELLASGVSYQVECVSILILPDHVHVSRDTLLGLFLKIKSLKTCLLFGRDHRLSVVLQSDQHKELEERHWLCVL